MSKTQAIECDNENIIFEKRDTDDSMICFCVFSYYALELIIKYREEAMANNERNKREFSNVACHFRPNGIIRLVVTKDDKENKAGTLILNEETLMQAVALFTKEPK